ncbi:MAG: hypothetical protein Q4F79_05420 [Eubacteriales bacterium]|nr:hypothetical protein [Eubacteriales bacterium]
MKSTIFTTGVIAGLAGMTIAAYAMKRTMPGTEMGRSVSKAAHTTAGAVSSIAQDAADAIDHVVK